MLTSSAVQRVERFANAVMTRAGNANALASSAAEATLPLQFPKSVFEPVISKGKEVTLDAAVLTPALWQQAHDALFVSGGQGAMVSDVFVCGIAACITFLKHTSAVTPQDALALVTILDSCLSRLNRANTIESHSLTLALVSVVDAAATFALEAPSGPIAAAMHCLLKNAATHGRRASASHPVSRVFTVRPVSSQLRVLGQLHAAVKENGNPFAEVAMSKMRLLQRLGLVYDRLRNSETDEDARCLRAVVALAAEYVATRSARHYVYFRGDADEGRLTMAGCSNVAVEVSAVEFALLPPLDPAAVDVLTSLQALDSARPVMEKFLQSWSATSLLVFEAFCYDSSWGRHAAEQRRRVVAAQAAKTARASKKALKEQEKQLKKQMRQRAMDALLKAKSEEEANVAEQRAQNGDEAVSASGASDMSRAESDVRSVMSAASFQSYSTFLSVVDSEALANEQRMQHESSDGNTNLPLLLLEMTALAHYRFMETVTDDSAYRITPVVAGGCWALISGLFDILSDLVDAQAGGGPLCFSLQEDVQYNKGLGYQCLGLVFARIVVPALLHERVSFGSLEAGARLEALHVSRTLAVYERVASQVINQNLAAVLDVCCAALNKGDAPTEAQSSLHRLLSTIVLRLGQSNQLSVLVKALLESRSPAENPDADKDDDDSDDEEQPQKGIDRETALKQTVLPVESTLMLLRTNAFREAFIGSVRKTLDIEGLLEDASAAVHASLEVPAGTGSVATWVSQRLPATLGVCSLICEGVTPTSLMAFSVFERLAELEVYIVTFADSVGAALLGWGEPGDGDASPLLAAVQQEEAVTKKSLRVLFLTVAECVGAIRRCMYGACLRDLGVDQLGAVLEVMNAGMWQLETAVTTSAPLISFGGGTLTVDTCCRMVPKSCRSAVTSTPSTLVLCQLAAQRVWLLRALAELVDFDDDSRDIIRQQRDELVEMFIESATHVDAAVLQDAISAEALEAIVNESGPQRWAAAAEHLCRVGLSVPQSLQPSCAAALATTGVLPLGEGQVAALVQRVCAGDQTAVGSLSQVMACSNAFFHHFTSQEERWAGAGSEPFVTTLLQHPQGCDTIGRLTAAAVSVRYRPEQATLVGHRFLVSLYDAIRADVCRGGPVLLYLLQHVRYLLPEGAVGAEEGPAPSLLRLAKTLIRSAPSAGSGVLLECSCWLVARHLPVYYDTADIGRLVSKAVPAAPEGSGPLSVLFSLHVAVATACAVIGLPPLSQITDAVVSDTRFALLAALAASRAPSEQQDIIAKAVSLGLQQSLSRSHSPAVLAAVLSSLRQLAQVPQLRFSLFKEAIAALLVAIAQSPSDRLVEPALALARVPLPALHGDASFADAHFAFMLAVVPAATRASVLHGVLASLTFLVSHWPAGVVQRAGTLPLLFRSLLNSAITVMDSPAAEGTETILQHFNAALSLVTKRCLFENAVTSSTSPLVCGPGTSPAAFVSCAIATQLYAVMGARSHVIARHTSPEIDFLARDLLVQMMRGRLPRTHQRKLVAVKRIAGKQRNTQVKRRRSESSSARRLGSDTFADLCFALSGTSGDAQDALRQTMQRIRDDDGRSIFRPLK